MSSRMVRGFTVVLAGCSRKEVQPVQKTQRASLKSFRLGSAEFDLGGVRELDPSARVTPGSHPRRQ